MSKMEYEQRLIDKQSAWKVAQRIYSDPVLLHAIKCTLDNASTVDAVSVDEIRVDFMSLCLYNQEAILNVSICGRPNEVRLPFSKEVAEVVHGRWEKVKQDLGDGIKTYRFGCSECGYLKNTLTGNYCPNCGAKMDGGINK